MKNLNEFKKLIELYRSTTIDQIEEAFKINPISPATIITGYMSKKCLLCSSVLEENKKPNCKECVYGFNEENKIGNCISDITYFNIKKANTPQELYDAFQARADYMEKYIK